jgi:lactoylglutathione lyase
MQIEHVALWTDNLERLKAFYVRYFGASAGEKYRAADRPFESYFLTFSSGARLELMWRPDLAEAAPGRDVFGGTHIAISVGSSAGVDALTTELGKAGYVIASPPRTTGDGYYESVAQDPDGNRIEITI